MELDISTPSPNPKYSYIGLQLKMDKISHEAVDPLDFENTFVGPSKIAGEGLFAKKTLSMGSVIANYAGILVDNSSQILHVKNDSFKEDLHKNLLTLNKTHAIDIPAPFDSLKKYKGSYGHKANHAFKGTNAYFGRIKSPRFGETRCLMASQNIDKGKEILIDYNYDVKNYVPQWYKELYVETFGKMNWFISFIISCLKTKLVDAIIVPIGMGFVSPSSDDFFAIKLGCTIIFEIQRFTMIISRVTLASAKT